MTTPTHTGTKPLPLAALGALMLLGAAAVLPLVAGASVVDKATTLLVYLLLATSWNLLAGYAGLVSVGQQAFFGLGGYFALRLVDGGVDAWPALLLGAAGAALAAWLLSFYVLRLKDGEFAVATWVLAEAIRILVMLDPLVQGETGTSLIALNAVEPTLRRNLAYALALAALAGVSLLLWWLLRSPTGLAARALGDDDEAAVSLGVRAMRTRQLIYVVAALAAGLAGVIWLASAITFLPRTNFGVQWSVLMLFMVLVGGLRSIEGPYIGALLLFLLQETLGHLGAWYLAGLGALAVACALWLPDGLAGALRRWRGRPLISLGGHLPASTPVAVERRHTP
ncbi:branched-chain amino acid ABC transporter permease [Rubrivivax albus]|uniref:Branched-chain amino acid ABC transporter permease n=1 Tax=Rubrivivax albus TaxID=2499835 RepID=A0A437JLW1_9BURK|nr:branched-chain amino acid ABC transporter permease [Rubrivivax albus]RVT47728.1 branched-chain amino acid ABC transporter permease [Rubrivivax albus]